MLFSLHCLQMPNQPAILFSIFSSRTFVPHSKQKYLFCIFLVNPLIEVIIVYLYDTAGAWSEWTKRVLLEIIILLDTEYIFYLILSNRYSKLWDKKSLELFLVSNCINANLQWIVLNSRHHILKDMLGLLRN